MGKAGAYERLMVIVFAMAENEEGHQRGQGWFSRWSAWLETAVEAIEHGAVSAFNEDGDQALYCDIGGEA